MSCGCEGSCCQSGMGRNLDLSILGRTRRGLRGLGNIKAGSLLAVGFKYSTGGLLYDPPDIEDLIQTVVGCTYATGAFANVSAEVSRGVLNNYLTVTVIPSIDFSQAEDIGGLIEGKLRECYPDFGALISKRDPTSLYSVPQDPNLPKATNQIAPGTPGGPPAPDKCAVDKDGKPREGLDYATCKLGLDSTGKGLGSSGLLFAIIAAVVIAKAFK